MFLQVGMQAENNFLDKILYHFSELKGVKMADLATLINEMMYKLSIHSP